MIHLISVTGPEDPALEVYTKLSEVQLKKLYEPNGGLFIAESPKVVQRALDAGCIPVSLLVEDRHVEGEAAEVIAGCLEISGDIPVYTGKYSDLVRLTGYALTRGVLCAMKRPPLRTVQEVLQEAESFRPLKKDSFHSLNKMTSSSVTRQSSEEKSGKEKTGIEKNGIEKSGNAGGAAPESGRAARIVVLENVMNPANVGAIFRNAAALGMDAVLLTDGCSDPLYRRTLRVSMGTTLQIPWAWIGRNIEDWKNGGLQMLREKGYRTIAMALREDALEISDLRLEKQEKAAVILGAEGDGLLSETIDGADSVAVIPMMRGVDSLNVAAASAVAFYEIGRR